MVMSPPFFVCLQQHTDSTLLLGSSGGSRLFAAPQCFERLSEARAHEVKLEKAGGGDDGGAEETVPRGRTGGLYATKAVVTKRREDKRWLYPHAHLGDVIGDDVVDGDVRVDGENNAQRQVDGEVQP